MRLPADDELIAYLDGELAPDARAEIERLLASSWDLRLRLAEIEREIQLYMQETAAEVEPEFPPAERVWSSLAARLEERPSPAKRRWKRAPLVGAVAAAVAFAAFLWLGKPPAISAAEALDRARRAEAAQLGSVVQPVVHRKLRVRKMDPLSRQPQTMVWEVWSPQAGPRARHGTAGGDTAVLDQLREVFAGNGLDADRPLSAAAYTKWRRGSEAARDRVERRTLADGVEAVVVTTETAPADRSTILAAGLTLRAADWRPVAEELTVRTPAGPARYEISELEFAVVAHASLPPSFFDPPAIVARTTLLPPPPPAAPPAAAPAAPPILPAADPDSLLLAALMAHHSLHRNGECGERSIGISRAAGDRVDVRGTVASAGRKAGLLEVLGGLPLMRLDLQVADAPARADDEIARGIGERQGLPESKAVSLLSVLQAIEVDGDALRRHVAGFDAAELQAAPAGVRIQFQQAIQEHLAALRANLAQAAALLGSEPDLDAGAAETPAGWHSALLALAANISRSCSPAQAVSADKGRLAAACLQLSRQAKDAGPIVSAAFGLAGPDVARTPDRH